MYRNAGYRKNNENDKSAQKKKKKKKNQGPRDPHKYNKNRDCCCIYRAPLQFSLQKFLVFARNCYFCYFFLLDLLYIYVAWGEKKAGGKACSFDKHLLLLPLDHISGNAKRVNKKQIRLFYYVVVFFLFLLLFFLPVVAWLSLLLTC